MLKKLPKSAIWLLALLLVVLVSSFAAATVQNSFFQVKVEKVKFETNRNNGKLSGYLYKPRGVDANNPAPAVVLTHGYLNNAEMQEIGAIELSRRGYVVLAFDMYDHGDSTWDTPGDFSFFVNAVYDAVQYVYDLDYVLKSSNGDGMIGISGHSMGGFSSTWAVIFDEQDFAANGYRKIAAALPVGADFRYVGAGTEKVFGPRSAGIIAAHWDQFFFDNVDTKTVKYKDFVKDAVGLSFLGREVEGNAKAATWYDSGGGRRIIYTPNETHPLNTWSIESGGYMIDFFSDSFEYQLAQHGLGTLEDYAIKTKSGQSWWLKEAFTLIALIALFMMILPAFFLLTKLPVFNKVYKNKEENETEDIKKEDLEKDNNNKVLVAEPIEPRMKKTKIIIMLLATLLGTYFLNIFMDRSVADMTLLADVLTSISNLTIILIVVVWVISLFKQEENNVKIAQRVTFAGLIVFSIALAFRWLLMHPEIIASTKFWSAPSINTIAYWAMLAGMLMLLITFITTPMFKEPEDDNVYGIKASWIQVGASLLTALSLTFGLLFIVALIEWIFKTDFRIYTYAIKIFNSHQFVAALKYIPVFFIYYFAASISVFTNTRKMKNITGDIVAALLLVGPVLLFLIYQYAVLYKTGVAAFPNFSLSAILLVGLVPTLTVAGIMMRRFSRKTGNIWTGVFFTTTFFTLITLANTAVYLISFK